MSIPFFFALTLMNLREIVQEFSPVAVWVFVGITFIVVIVDILLVTNDVPSGDTISNIVRNWAYARGFVLSFIWGVLAGHFFLIEHKPGGLSIGWGLIAGLVLLLVLAGYLLRPRVTPPWHVFLLIAGVGASFLQLI